MNTGTPTSEQLTKTPAEQFKSLKENREKRKRERENQRIKRIHTMYGLICKNINTDTSGKAVDSKINDNEGEEYALPVTIYTPEAVSKKLEHSSDLKEIQDSSHSHQITATSVSDASSLEDEISQNSEVSSLLDMDLYTLDRIQLAQDQDASPAQVSSFPYNSDEPPHLLDVHECKPIPIRIEVETQRTIVSAIDDEHMTAEEQQVLLEVRSAVPMHIELDVEGSDVVSTMEEHI